MTTSKQILAIIASTFPRVPEKNLKKLSGENATAEDIYVVVHLLERYIQYQDAVIATLVRDLMAKGILGRPAAAPTPANVAAPAPDAADGGADWVMAGINPNDKSPSPSERAAGGPADGGADWVMAGIEGDGPAPSSAQPPVAPPPPAPPQNGGGAASVTPIQPLPNVQASGAPVPNDIQAMFARQAAEMNKAKPVGQ